MAAELEEQWKSILADICLCFAPFRGVEQMPAMNAVLWFELCSVFL